MDVWEPPIIQTLTYAAKGDPMLACMTSPLQAQQEERQGCQGLESFGKVSQKSLNVLLPLTSISHYGKKPLYAWLALPKASHPLWWLSSHFYSIAAHMEERVREWAVLDVGPVVGDLASISK